MKGAEVGRGPVGSGAARRGAGVWWCGEALLEGKRVSEAGCSGS